VLNSDPRASLVYGDYEIAYADGRVEQRPKISFDFEICLYAYCMVPQPGSLYRSDMLERAGGIDDSFNYSFDYDLALALSKVGHVRHVRYPVSRFLVHPGSKSAKHISHFRSEDEAIRVKHGARRGAVGKALRYWHLGRAVQRFARERGYVPVRSTQDKA
jgi:GT2 family glycosyltransferase